MMHNAILAEETVRYLEEMFLLTFLRVVGFVRAMGCQGECKKSFAGGILRRFGGERRAVAGGKNLGKRPVEG
jgi:hypothetical protein